MSLILVTGFGGFLGQAIARRLIESGFRVRGIARKRYPDLESLGVEGIQGDISDAEAVRQACEGCAGIVHTAAKAGVWGNWSDYYQVNTVATNQLLDIGRQSGASAFVYTSSPSVTFAGRHQSGIDESISYPDKWLCHYPATKALAERAVLAHAAQSNGAMRTCALRPHLIWGLGDPHLFPRVVQRAMQGKLRRVGEGRNLIDTVHVENAAQAHVRALEKLLDGSSDVNGQAFFLTDGEPIECWEWISKILQTAGMSVPEQSISYPMAYRIGAVLETIFRTLGRKEEPPMTRFVASQLALDHYFSIDKARRLLDYKPDIDRDAVLERCKDWLQALAGSTP